MAMVEVVMVAEFEAEKYAGLTAVFIRGVAVASDVLLGVSRFDPTDDSSTWRVGLTVDKKLG